MAIVQEHKIVTNMDGPSTMTTSVMNAAEDFMETHQATAAANASSGEDRNANESYENWLREYDVNGKLIFCCSKQAGGLILLSTLNVICDAHTILPGSWILLYFPQPSTDVLSMFQSNSQQVAADLDSFDFASTTGNQDIPYITNTSKNTTSMSPDMIPSSAKEHYALTKKRSSAEISEDEGYAGSSSRCYKLSRNTCPSSDSEGSSVCSNPRLSMNGTRNRRIPTGYASSSSFIEEEAEYRERMNERPPADTSTDHIKALTSSKGATMCFDIVNAMKKNKNSDDEDRLVSPRPTP